MLFNPSQGQGLFHQNTEREGRKTPRTSYLLARQTLTLTDTFSLKFVFSDFERKLEKKHTDITSTLALHLKLQTEIEPQKNPADLFWIKLNWDSPHWFPDTQIHQ